MIHYLQENTLEMISLSRFALKIRLSETEVGLTGSLGLLYVVALLSVLGLSLFYSFLLGLFLFFSLEFEPKHLTNVFAFF